MLGVGDRAPEFKLTDVAGNERSLADFVASKPALITLFKVSCPVCQLTLPYLERLSASNTLEVVAISQDDEEATQEFREAFGITLTTLLDTASSGYAVSNAFGITHVPSMFLVEPGGGVSMAVSGFSKRDIEAAGRLAGIEPFTPDDDVPQWKAG